MVWSWHLPQGAALLLCSCYPVLPLQEREASASCPLPPRSSSVTCGWILENQSPVSSMSALMGGGGGGGRGLCSRSLCSHETRGLCLDSRPALDWVIPCSEPELNCAGADRRAGAPTCGSLPVSHCSVVFVGRGSGLLGSWIPLCSGPWSLPLL